MSDLKKKALEIVQRSDKDGTPMESLIDYAELYEITANEYHESEGAGSAVARDYILIAAILRFISALP